METNFEKIKNIVNRSLLSTTDKNELLSIFTKAQDGDLAELAGVLSEDSTWISRLSDNLKAKHIVLSSKDATLWQKILKEEVAQLEGLRD